MTSVSRLETKKIVSEIVAIWAGLLGGVAAAIFALTEYRHNRKLERVERVLAYHAQYVSDRMQNSVKTIAEAWSNDALFEKAIKSDDAFRIYSLEVDATVSAELHSVIEFYESLNTCVEQSLCDESTAYAFFGPEAVRFFKLHAHFIAENKRQFGRQFGSDLEIFARSSLAYTKANPGD